MITFSEALRALKQGKKITRHGWNGKGQYVALQIPNEESKMKQPYLYICPVDGKLIPWVASQSDILADDWDIIEDLP